MRLTDAAAKLAAGESVSMRPTGSSMEGRISSGELIIIAPCVLADVEVGDIVLSKVKGRYFVHLVRAIKTEKNGKKLQIANNHGHINGWTRKVFGKVVQVGDPPAGKAKS